MLKCRGQQLVCVWDLWLTAKEFTEWNSRFFCIVPHIQMHNEVNVCVRANIHICFGCCEPPLTETSPLLFLRGICKHVGDKKILQLLQIMNWNANSLELIRICAVYMIRFGLADLFKHYLSFQSINASTSVIWLMKVRDAVRGFILYFFWYSSASLYRNQMTGHLFLLLYCLTRNQKSSC